MEDFNPDDPLEIHARRDENEEENDFKATKEKDDKKESVTKFTATLLLLATQRMQPRRLPLT